MANPYEDIFQNAIRGDNGALYAGNVSTGDDWQKNLPSNEGLTTSPIGRPLQAAAKATDQAVTNAAYNMRTSQLGEDPNVANAGIIPAPAERPTGPANPEGDAMMSNRGIIPTGTDNPPAAPTTPEVDPNSQAGGAAAAAKQQEGINATSQKTAEQATKGGVTPPTVTTQAPSESLAARNQNIQTGVGNPLTGTNTPDLPNPLTPQQQKNAALDKAGQETFSSMNIQPHWWQSGSILGGMMSMGLALLDGKGYSEAFQSGVGYYDQHYGAEQRGAWADDLLKKGYTRESIAQYIQSGNSKDLSNVQDIEQARQAKQQAYQIGQAGLQNQQLQNKELAYQQSPEMRQQQQEDRDINNKYKRAQTAYELNQISPEAQAYQKQKQELELKNLQSEIDVRQDKINRAGDLGGINTVTLPNGMTASVSGQEPLPGVHYQLDARGRVQGDSRWKQGIDIATGKGVNIPANMQQYEIAATNSDNAIQRLQNFQIEGQSLFGPAGEIKRNVLDFFGQRSTADLESRAEELQGMVDNLAESRATLESGGFKPTNVALDNAKAAFPTFGHYEHHDGVRVFVPSEMSQERFKQAVQSIGQQAAQMRHFAHQYSSPDQIKDSNAMQFQVSQGTRKLNPKDGKWYIAAQTGDMRSNIWRLDPNQ